MTTVRDCHYPWTGFMIWSSGKACCCCYGSSAVGDVSQASPESVWNNPTMESLRASLSAGVVHSVCESGTCKYVVGSRASHEPGPPAPKPWGFDERWYVAHYFDVREGIGNGRWRSGLDHYRKHGHLEFRSTNEGEWQRAGDERQERSIRIGTGYGATLTWLEPASVDAEAIVLRVSAANSGSIPWRTRGQGPAPIQAAAESYRRLEDFHQTRPMYSYRADLPGPVEPGCAVPLELRAPVGDLPIGRSFLIVDLLSDERAVRLSSSGARPLVLGVHRDERTDQIDLVAG